VTDKDPSEVCGHLRLNDACDRAAAFVPKNVFFESGAKSMTFNVVTAGRYLFA
jgi:hypothetical protein